MRLEVDTIENGEPGRVNARAAATAAGRRAAGRADPPQALARANAELSRPGVPFDLAQLKPEQLEDLVEHLDEVTLEVDHPEAKVRLCE